jgi:hypothetical protein
MSTACASSAGCRRLLAALAGALRPDPGVRGWGLPTNSAVINVDNYFGSCGRIPDWNKTNLRLVRYDIENDCHPRDENGFYQVCKVGEIGEAMGFIVDHPEIGGGRFEGYTSSEATESKIRRNVFRQGDAYWSSGDLLREEPTVTTVSTASAIPIAGRAKTFRP